MSLDPDSWSQLADKIPGPIPAIITSMVIALLRVIYDQEETKPVRITLETILCGALTYLAWLIILLLGMDIRWAVVVGGCVGFLGTVVIRSMALKLLKRKVNK